MKKSCLMLASVLLISCGTSASNAAQTSNAAVSPEVSEAPKTETVSARNTADLLLGEWELIVKGETAANTISGIRISFDDGGLRINDSIRNSSSFSDVTFGDIYQLDNGQITMMTVTPKEVNGVVSEEEILANPVDFEILLSSVYGETYLALRELGNGMSYFGISQFQTEYQDENYFWTFRKLGDEPADLPTGEIRKNEEFYAFCWFRTEDSLYLQEIKTEAAMEDWYGLERPTLYFVMDEEPKAAIPYPVAEEIQWRVFPEGIKAWAGSVVPYLMRVITDSEGNIVRFYEMQYLGYGFYEASEGSMFDYSALLPSDSPELVFVVSPGGILTHEEDMVYVDASSGAPSVTAHLFTKTQLLNFRVLNIMLEEFDDAGEPIFLGTEVYRQDRFYPEHPIALTVTMIGDIPNNAISYEEPYGDVKYYALYQSGMDGSLQLEELKHVIE